MSSVSNVKLICSQLDLTPSTWNSYIKEGVITKQPKAIYNIATVSREVIRHQRNLTRKNVKSANAAGNKLAALQKKYDKLLENGASASAGVTTPTGEFIQPKMSVKESIDLEISKQRLEKMKHENRVRKKQVMPTDNVFEFVTTIASEFAASLNPMLSGIKQIIPSMNARQYDEVGKLFANTRNDLSRHVEGKTTTDLIELFNPDVGDTGDDDG